MADLRSMVMTRLRPESWGEDEHKLYLSAVHRPELTLGPAHQWVLERLTALCLAIDKFAKESPQL